MGSIAACAAPGSAGGSIYDLSGNAGEWEDACDSDSGKDDSCRLRGGSFLVNGAALRCDGAFAQSRDTIGFSYGFRCCSE